MIFIFMVRFDSITHFFYALQFKEGTALRIQKNFSYLPIEKLLGS